MKYYTTKEAMDILDVTKPGLLFMVRKYEIRTKRIEKWNRLMLSTTDVDALKDRPRRKRRSGEMRQTTRVTRWGYVERYHPRHPCANTSGFVPEHKLVMERKIGRQLTQKEVVHHIDGDRANNHPDNLILFSGQGEHLKVGHYLDGVWKKWSYKFVKVGADKKLIREFIAELTSELGKMPKTN
jgi:hypothetical protein